MAVPRLRDYTGPAILSYGFRLFFFSGAVFAGLAILVWVPMFFGWVHLPTALPPRDWHVHEMLYGYLAPVITGFLLTAIPNWTGRLPLQGRPLLVLFAAWAIGRIAIAFSEFLPPLLVALLDLSFLGLVAAACAREVIAARNWRNLRVLALVAILIVGDVAFHVEVAREGSADYGIRIAIAGAIMLVVLIGGRIVPSFTRNWLVRMNPGRLPQPFGPADIATMAVSGVALALWIVATDQAVTGYALIAAALLQAFRLARWAGDRTWRDPLVFVLHAAYAFVPLGFLLTGLAALQLVPVSAGIHAWTGGAIGTMTLAVMTRASLGHTGRALVASSATQAIYGVACLSAVARIAAALAPQWSGVLLPVAGLAWAAAFLGFAASYFPVLALPSRKRT